RLYAAFFHLMVLSTVAYWTTQKFSTEYPCHIELIRLGCVCVRFSPCGLIHDTSCRRGARPQCRRALVQSCRATAGISHRTVRDRALAALSQRTRLSRKYPGSQGRRRNLAQSRNTRGLARQYRRRPLLARSRAIDAATGRLVTRAGPIASAAAGANCDRTAAARYSGTHDPGGCSGRAGKRTHWLGR